MDGVLFGRSFLEFALLYPGAYLCLAPLRDHLKAPKTTCWIAGGALTALCLGCAALCAIFELPSNVFLLPILIVSFRLLRWRTEGVTVSQTAFLFSISAVMLAVCSLLAVVLNARAETGNEQEDNLVSTALLALDIHTGAIVASHARHRAGGYHPDRRRLDHEERLVPHRRFGGRICRSRRAGHPGDLAAHRHLRQPPPPDHCRHPGQRPDRQGLRL